MIVRITLLLTGLLCWTLTTRAADEATGNWTEHGVVAPVGRDALTLATTDGAGRQVVFTKLTTGGKISYLFIDAETGQTEQIHVDSATRPPEGVALNPERIVYDAEDGHLLGVDLDSRAVYRLGRFGTGLALGFLRTDDGMLYLGIYPSAHLFSFNPATQDFTDLGKMNKESWTQYLRPLASDASGWVYGGIAMERMQIVGYNPATGEMRKFIPDENRFRGYIPQLFRGVDGKVYARADRYQVGDVLEVHENGWGWHALWEGQATPVDEPARRSAQADQIALGMGARFPDGSTIRLNVNDRQLSVFESGREEPRVVSFNYQSDGVPIYNIIAGPDGKVYGSTGHPMRVWCFDPHDGQFWDRGLASSGLHTNQFVRQGEKLYGTVYSTGAIFEYDPRQDYNESGKVNPRWLHRDTAAFDLYGRPRAMLAHNDGRHILVGGMAARVLYGSGLLIYDIERGRGRIVDRSALVPDQGIQSLVSLPGGDVLIGTTTYGPTAAKSLGTRDAMIYRFNLPTRKVTGRWTLKPRTPAVADMILAGDGLVYGLAESNLLFVFDPAHNEVIRTAQVDGYGNVSGYQAPRCMAIGPDGAIYALFQQAVIRIDPATLEHKAISRPASTITTGIAIVGDRLYYGCGTRLFSCALK